MPLSQRYPRQEEIDMRWPWQRKQDYLVASAEDQDILREVQESRREAETKLAQTENNGAEVRKVAQHARRLRAQNDFGQRIADVYTRRPRHG